MDDPWCAGYMEGANFVKVKKWMVTWAETRENVIHYMFKTFKNPEEARAYAKSVHCMCTHGEVQVHAFERLQRTRRIYVHSS